MYDWIGFYDKRLLLVSIRNMFCLQTDLFFNKIAVRHCVFVPLCCFSTTKCIPIWNRWRVFQRFVVLFSCLRVIVFLMVYLVTFIVYVFVMFLYFIVLWHCVLVFHVSLCFDARCVFVMCSFCIRPSGPPGVHGETLTRTSINIFVCEHYFIYIKTRARGTRT